MIIQILVCVAIYIIIYSIQTNQYVFSEDFINKANEILSHDTNFVELYEMIKGQVMRVMKQEPEDNANNEVNDEANNEGIGGAEGEIEEEQEAKNTEDNVSTNDNQENIENLSQEELDIQNIKNTTTFIKPVEGTISSKYGRRDTATGSVPKNHTGTDIAANTGTKIKSATDGEVVLASEEGDYRKTFKNSDW